MLVGNNAIAFRLVIITKYLFGCLETLGRKQWAGHWTEVQLDEAVMSALGQKQTCVQATASERIHSARAATRSSTIARAARRGGFSFGGLSFAGQARTNFYSFWQLLERIENIAQRTDATRVVKL
jgi:hypothetical protein